MDERHGDQDQAGAQAPHERGGRELFTPNEDATVTLVKAVYPGALQSEHGFAYPLGETVEAPDYAPTSACGHGLHFGPTREVAKRYHTGTATFLRCRVPLATLIPIRDKCKAKSCYVEAIDD